MRACWGEGGCCAVLTSDAAVLAAAAAVVCLQLLLLCCACTCCCCAVLASFASSNRLLCLIQPPLQGLDDAFVAQTPILDAYPEDLYDPSDPTDRQQIEWRAGSQGAQQGSQQQGVGEAAAAAEQVAGGGPEQQAVASPAAAAVPEGMGSPPQRCSSTAGDAVGGYAHSATSDHTSTAHGGEAAGGGAAKQLSMPAQLQKDAFLVFRALCKLSIRSTDSAPGSEVTTIRGKVRQGVDG